MALPKSLTQPLRQGQLTVGAGWRAYFANFNQQFQTTSANTSNGPTIYDLMVNGKFIDGNSGPPAGWWDLGLVKNVKFTPGSKIGNVATGYRGAIRAKYRAEVSEKCSCVFMEMSRTTLRIATGTQVFNILKTTSAASTVGPMSSSGTPAVAMGASGYIASGSVANFVGKPTLYVPSGSGAMFPATSYIVCDQDYNNTSWGFIGDAGANVFQGAVSDVDFIRKTSDYVACVLAVVPNAGGSGQDALILNQKFMGGGNDTLGTPNTAPTAGAKVQAIQGYVTREGGTKIQYWSAIFTLDTIDTSQIMFYLPRIAPDTFAGIDATNLQNATSEQTYELNATFDALAFDDPLDGETVVRYGAYYPISGQQIQI